MEFMIKHFQNSLKYLLINLIILFLSGIAVSDTLIMRNGSVKQGVFIGSTEGILQFEVNGKIENIPIRDVTSLTFAPQPVNLVPPAPPEPGLSSAILPTVTGVKGAKGSLTVPAGTKMRLMLDGDISTATHQKGASITALLDKDLSVNGVVAAPKGTKLYGKVVQSMRGGLSAKQQLVFHFTEISVNNRLIPISTDLVGAEGVKGGSVSKVGAGTLIGSGFGGASGTGTGTLNTGGLGRLEPGNNIRFTAGTFVELNLKKAVTINR